MTKAMKGAYGCHSNADWNVMNAHASKGYAHTSMGKGHVGKQYQGATRNFAPTEAKTAHGERGRMTQPKATYKSGQYD